MPRQKDEAAGLGLLAQISIRLLSREKLNEDAVMYYGALKSAGRLRQVLLAEYRCGSGCLLFAVFQTPAGPAFFRPAYRLDPHSSEQRRGLQSSSMSGPEKETIEGVGGRSGQFGAEDRPGRWSARGGLMENMEGIVLRCEHVDVSYPSGDIPYGKVGRAVREIVTISR